MQTLQKNTLLHCLYSEKAYIMLAEQHMPAMPASHNTVRQREGTNSFCFTVGLLLEILVLPAFLYRRKQGLQLYNGPAAATRFMAENDPVAAYASVS